MYSYQHSLTPVTNYTPRGLFGSVYTHLFTRHTPTQRRHLLSFEDTSDNDNYPSLFGDSSDEDNCTDPRGHHHGYNDSCDFVLGECGGEAALINYLSFVLCDFATVEVCQL